MNCPVCKRSLAPTLSICFACGAMVNDSVREELETKIVSPSARLSGPPMRNVAMEYGEPENAEIPVSKTSAPIVATPAAPVKKEIPRPSPPLKRETNPLNGPKTSPTLVEFQNKNATMPDWRLQLQNSVRQRKGGPTQRTEAVSDQRQTRLVTNGANALKVEQVEEVTLPETKLPTTNAKVANALKRIDESRKTFSPEVAKKKETKPSAASRNYPFNVIAKSQPSPSKPQSGKPVVNESPRPTLVPTFKIEKKKFDTNKLPPIASELEAGEKLDSLPVIDTPSTNFVPTKPDISIHVTEPDAEAQPLADVDEIEDLAPISMRFNSALFDLIIGAFGSFVLLSPIILLGGAWFSLSGIAAFAGIWATTMFIYMTLSIGMYGKTLGMRMFGLELVDAEENDYPTFHQAAVHSAVFLLSLPFLGIGFLPIIFNEEQRAAHDLAAGTIIVAEF